MPVCLLGEDDLEALKAKNIKQTELVADLREAILRVARHFQCTDPKNCSVVSGRLPFPSPFMVLRLFLHGGPFLSGRS